jgi:hypothetical protein
MISFFSPQDHRFFQDTTQSPLYGFTCTHYPNMISSTRLTTEEFARRFPPGGKPNPPRAKASSKDGKKNDMTPIPNDAILNDVPVVATSCLVYDYGEPQAHVGDSTYPIPPAENFPALRSLESRQAVFKRIKDDKCVFLHMLLSPEDGLELFGQEFRDELASVRRDVWSLFQCG